jgi:hypothetical protein
MGGHMIAAANRPKGRRMDHAATARHLYQRINAADIDGIGDLLAESFVEHEEMAGLSPT